MPDAAFQLRLVARQLLAVLLATTALGVVSARAVDGTWLGGNAADPNEWTDPANWTSNPSLPDGPPHSTSGAATVANDNGPVVIARFLFTAAPTRSPIRSASTTSSSSTDRGSSTIPQYADFNVSDSLVFQNGSSANAAHGPSPSITMVSSFFRTPVPRAIATIVNNSILQFNGTSTAGSAIRR